MRIAKSEIKKVISASETDLYFCWELLCDLKNNKLDGNDFTNRFISFQENLALVIFRLQTLRDNVIGDEKYFINNKEKYKYNWFKNKMNLLSSFKKVIDYTINISRALGDAYAFFFYKSDLDLLSKHLSHQRVVNYTTSIGKIGELEFIKKIKHLEGDFVLNHDITNILRYGDFSFVDLKTMKVTKIGELKTSAKEENVLNLELSIIDRNGLKDKKKPLDNDIFIKTRKDRQLLGIINLLIREDVFNSTNISLEDKSYSNDIELLLKKSEIGKHNFVKVSDGLAFVCIKYKKNTLYNKIFKKSWLKNKLEKHKQELVETALSLMKPTSNYNSLVIGQLLYESDLTVKEMAGTIPFFWQPINTDLLKEVYFTTCVISSLFNPIHLIEKVENLGYKVDSKYISNERYESKVEIQKHIQYFDSFIPHIVEHLLTENSILESIREVERYANDNNLTSVIVKPQRHITPNN